MHVRGILAAPISEERAWKAICRLAHEHPADNLKPKARQKTEIQEAIVNVRPAQRVYAFGGSDDANRLQTTVEVLDTMAGTWDPFELSMVEPRNNLGAAVVGDQIYVVGGTRLVRSGLSRKLDVDVYDTKSGEWTSMPSLTTNYTEDFAVAAIGGKLYIIGGRRGSELSQNCYVYSPPDNTWAPACNIGTPRCGLATAVVEQQLYVLGGSGQGQGGFEDLDSVEVFTPNADIWSPVPDMRMQRTWLAAAATENEVFAIGGLCNSRPQSSLEVFDLREQIWDILPEMQFTRSHLAAVVANRKLFVIGGNNGSKLMGKELILNEVEMFDIDQREWHTHAPMTKRRNCLAAVAC